jgi:hypothetical protein
LASEIIEKIRKLLKHSQSAEDIGNLAEAESFAAMAQKYMLQHKLDMSDIEAEDFKLNEPIENVLLEPKDFGVKSSSDKVKQNWFSILLFGLADAHFCRMVRKTGDNSYYIIGRKSDRDGLVDITRYLVDTLYEVCEVEIIRQRAAGVLNSSGVRKYRNGYRLGFASAISRRVRTERQQLMDHSVTEQGLVRIDAIYREFYEFQSYAIAELFNGAKWNELASIPHSNMKTERVTAKEHVNGDLFREDVQVLLDRAARVLM